MAIVTTSATAPTIAASDATVGAVAWATPANIYGAGSATAGMSAGQQTEYLKASGFNFSSDIPTNAVILGITVSITKSRSAGTGTITDTAVYLGRRGTILSSAPNHASQGAAWTDSDAVSTYGGTTDTWGIPFLPEELNAYDFLVVFSCSDATANATASVNTITITVTYEEGYVAGPQVLDPGEVMLFGQRYQLAREQDGSVGRVRTTLASVMPPKSVTNRDYGRDSDPYQSSLAGDDLSGGMGHWRYRYDADGKRLNGNCFWTGENIWTLDKGAITLGPLATDGGTPTATTRRISAIDILKAATDGVVVAFHAIGVTEVIYNYSPANAWSALRANSLIGVSRPTCRFNSRLFFPSGNGFDNGYSYLSETSTAVDVPAAGNLHAISFAVWDGKLYGLDTAGVLYASPTGDAGSWETLAKVPAYLMPSGVFGGTAPLVLKVYDDAAGEPVLWAVGGDGVYLYDAASEVWVSSRWTMPYSAMSANYYNGGIAEVYRDSIYVRNDARDLFRLTMNGGSLVVQDVRPGSPDGLVAAYQTEIKGLAASSQYLFCVMTPVSTTASATQVVLAWNEQGWHPIVTLVTDFGDLNRIAVVNDGTNRRLYWEGAADNDTDAVSLRHIELDEMEQHPLFSTARTYAAAGNVELPVDDGGFPEQRKTARVFRLKINSISPTTADETAQVAYRINGSTGSYTNLGSAVAVNEEVSIPFGTNGVGLEFRSIQFRFSLARGSTTTDRPVIEYWSCDYERNFDVIKGYTIMLNLQQDGPNGKSPQQMLDQIEAHLHSTLYGTFCWRDDAGNTRSKLVKLLKPEGMEQTGYNYGSTVTLQLLERANN